MAAPITHIILALQILSLLPSHFDHKEFIVGTSFPDIRYMAKLDRTATHFEPVSWHDVLYAKSAFHAGMLFHNLVDILRIKHFEPHFYNRLDLQRYSTQYIKLFPLSMKIAEDAVLYSVCNQWPEIMSYFDTIYDEELAICPDQKMVKKWHSVLRNYLQQSPTEECVFLKHADQLSTDHERFQAKEHFDYLVGLEDFKHKVISFYHNFTSYLSSERVTTPKGS